MKYKNVLSEAGTIDKYKDKFKEVNRAVNMKAAGDDKITDYLLNKFDSGKLYIEFASPEEFGTKQKTKIIVKFEGDTTWLMNYSKGEGPIKFNSAEELFAYMEDSVKSVTDYVDLKKSFENIFHPTYYRYVKQQISDFVQEYPNKAQSLTYDKLHALPGENNSNWDMEVIFRKNRVLRGKDHVDPRIFPSMGGDMNYGKIIQPNEKEVTDPDLWQENKY